VPSLRLFIALAVAALGPGGLAAQAVLEPPLGLHWGDSPEKLITWASKHALDVTINLPGDQPALRVLRIAARNGFLPGMQAGAVEARFLAGRLFEVSLDYADPTAPAQVIEARFEKLKRQLTSEYGQLSPNRSDRTLDDGFATRRVSLHREPVQGLFLLLAFTEVEDTLRKTRDARFTLLYRNDNLRRQVESDLAREAASAKPPAEPPPAGG
jgi:hypothetical protein